MRHFIARLRGCAFAALLVLTACSKWGGPKNFTAPPVVDVVALVDTIQKTIIKETGEYVVPMGKEIEDFRKAVNLVMDGDVLGADALLDKYAYDVYTIRSSVSHNSLVVFRERAPEGGGDVKRGWGTYIFNKSLAAQRADIHVNHPLFDKHTEEIGADLFQDCRCRWLFVAGAHRHANSPSDDADMARATNSVFHQMYVHVAASNVRTLSIHGFLHDNPENPENMSLPRSVAQVLSVGSLVDKGPVQTPGAEEEDLLARLTKDDVFVAGLSHFTPGYKALGNTENPQGHHSNNEFVGLRRWMSVETEAAVRGAPADWGKMNDILRQWIIDFPA